MLLWVGCIAGALGEEDYSAKLAEAGYTDIEIEAPRIYNVEDARAFLTGQGRGRGFNDEWHWSLRLKSCPDQIIGCISLMRAENNNRGFWMGLPWQGQGLMSEAVEAVTDYWFDELKFPVIRAPKAIVNAASRRISERSGMRVVAVEEREFVSGRLVSEIWEITAEEWMARHTRARQRTV